MRFETDWMSKPGGRDHNEDRCAMVSLENGNCWALADGLGGHGGGEIASGIAVEAILDEFRGDPQCSPEAILVLLESANRQLRERQTQDARLAQMRTTAVVLTSDFCSACWGHIGDSRLYLFRNGCVALQTHDHSVPQSLADMGKIAAEEIRFHPDRNRMLRALGDGAEPRPSIECSAKPLSAGDAFLICSDGFWEYVTEIEMAADYACSRKPREWLERMEKRLWKRAPQDHDNYSAIGIFLM
jgi:PPM family protein phosphatase